MFISKYALSKGVFETPGKVIGDSFHADGYWSSFRIGRDAHSTIADALQAAESARLLKIASLEKQIKKLQRMKFA